TEQAFPRDVCVHELFEAQAARTPEAVAVTFEGTSLTYGALNEQATQLAAYLQRLGVGPDVLVGVYMERSFDFIISLAGIWKAGGAYVPLDPFNPSQRLLHMVEDSNVKIILTQGHLQGKLEVAEDVSMISLDEINRQKVVDEDETAPIVEREVQPHHLAYVIYTSGSTGRPKGVMVEHRNISHLICGYVKTYNLTAKDRSPHLAGLGFDATVWEIWSCLTIGASIVLVDEEARLSPEKLKDWLIKHKITITFITTPLVKVMQTLEWPTHTSLRYLLTGGEKMTTTPVSPLPFTLINYYGPTETTVVVTAGEVKVNATNQMPPIGKPIPNARIYILDKQMQPVPIGVPGEICIGGLGVTRGYLGKKELTQEKFIPSPFDKGERLYRSGDIGTYNADGNIEYIGRIDHQVKINGVRMELGEIATVLHSHEQVKEAIVIVREDEYIGKQLVAYVVVDEQQEHMDHILQHYMTEQLPQVMVPSVYVFLNALPLNANGKVDRKALPVPDTYVAEEQVVHPSTSMEKTVARACQELLGTNNISMSDNFFKLGGHSLLAAQFISRLRKTLDVEIPLRTVFDTTTLAALAAAIEGILQTEQRAKRLVLRSVERTSAGTSLSFAQQRLWFLDQLEPGSAKYNVPSYYRLQGAL
ncbi:non-ribosomal peptide synthetase, partial [Chengkuizengella marina]